MSLLKIEEINNDWRKTIEEWNKEKREFMRLTPEEKAERILPFFYFTIQRDFGIMPNDQQKEEFKKRAIAFYQKNSGRMFPDLDVIYKGEVKKTNIWTIRCINNDLREERYFR